MSQSYFCWVFRLFLRINNEFYKLGLLIGSETTNYGTSTEALHPALARAIYDIYQPGYNEAIENAETEDKLRKINEEDLDFFYDLNIMPHGKSK